ncbi:Serine/threonine-protein kinase AFC3 [Zea mays]|uniref:Serine/threonine-protein kinase AFC3 n=1 Tax=Zea mays TaxID=4577 RepID=A0A1D6FYF2_MAIZE|nr:Serine/threonine-protein kinase AFC3 [Zea mays]
MYSSSAQKYFRRATRLNWPEGAVSRESIRAVRKLDRLKVLVLSFLLLWPCLSINLPRFDLRNFNIFLSLI